MKLNSLSQEVFCAFFWFFFPPPLSSVSCCCYFGFLAGSVVDLLAVEIMSRVPGNVTPCLEFLEEEILEKEQMMCGDFRDFQDLLDNLKSSGHSQCTTVWTKDSVAYRCRTCQVNDARSVFECALLLSSSYLFCLLLLVACFVLFWFLLLVFPISCDVHFENCSRTTGIGNYVEVNYASPFRLHLIIQRCGKLLDKNEGKISRSLA